MPGIGIIHNPHSRQNRRHPDRMTSLGTLVGKNGTSVATQQPGDVRAWARLFREQQIDILGINGGDGSNHVTLTAFIEEYGEAPLPRITFLRGGTMNTISNACGIKGSPAGLLLNLIHKYTNGIPFETIHRDTIRVEGRYGFLFGNGLIHNFLSAYYATGKPSPWMACRLVGQGALSSLVGGSLSRRLFRPFRARVTVDGRRWERETYTAMVAGTIHQIGLGFKPFFRCEERPHSFHLLGIVASPSELVLSLPQIYLGRKISEHSILEAVAETVVFESEEPLQYTLDGDTHQAGTRLALDVGPRLEIIVR